MSGNALSHPSGVTDRLTAIEDDLAQRQNVYETAARNWIIAKRDKEHRRAVEFLKATGTVAERNALADQECALDGKEAEAEWEALKAVMRTLECRASIGQSILRSQSRLP